MASSSRAKRQRGSDRASASASGDIQANESVLDAINDGRDPSRNGKMLARAVPAQLDGVPCDAAGEQRAYVLTESELLSLFFPSSVTRDKNKPLLPDWGFVKLLPPQWYAIVFAVQGKPGCFRAVSTGKLSVDSYPAAGKAGDPERAAGFTGGDSLRLVVFPHALRFFWASLHEPLRAEGAWPTAQDILMRGFVLAPEVRASLGTKLDAVAPDGAAPGWCASFRETIRERHWGAPPTDPLAQLELIAPLLSSTATDAATTKRLLAACLPIMAAAADAMPLVTSPASVREAIGIPDWLPLEAACRMAVASAAIIPKLPVDVRYHASAKIDAVWAETVELVEANLSFDEEFFAFDARSAVYRGPAGRTRAEHQHIGYTRMLVETEPTDGAKFNSSSATSIQFDEPRFPSDYATSEVLTFGPNECLVDLGAWAYCTEAECAAAIERHTPGRTDFLRRPPGFACALSHVGPIPTLSSLASGASGHRRSLLGDVLSACGFGSGVDDSEHRDRIIDHHELKWVNDGYAWKPVGHAWPEAGRLTRADVRARLIEALDRWRSEATPTRATCDRKNGMCAQCQYAVHRGENWGMWERLYGP